MLNGVQLGADIAQYAIPISAGLVALSEGDQEEVVYLILLAIVQKVELVILKYCFPKERPNGKNMKSFPSGHSAAVFLAVGFLSSKYGVTPLTIMTIFAATVVAYSRNATKDHWPVDVLAGSLLGLLNGTLAGTRCFQILDRMDLS